MIFRRRHDQNTTLLVWHDERLRNLEKIISTLEKEKEQAEQQRDSGEDQRDKPLPQLESAPLNFHVTLHCCHKHCAGDVGEGEPIEG